MASITQNTPTTTPDALTHLSTIMDNNHIDIELDDSSRQIEELENVSSLPPADVNSHLKGREHTLT